MGVRRGTWDLCWLPIKLAEWIGENMQDVLGFPDKADLRAQPGARWTPAELNHILHAHVLDSALTTFRCVEWESNLFRGTMSARCYPFDMLKRRFHSFNAKVSCRVLILSVHTLVMFVNTSMYWYIP
jgi:hypothetical protein